MKEKHNRRLFFLPIGGYLGCINEALRGGSVRWASFAYYGRYFFWRLLGLTLLVIAFSMVVGLVAVGLGLVVLLPLVGVLMVLFLLIDYALVGEDLKVGEAFARGPQVMLSVFRPIPICPEDPPKATQWY